MNKEGTVYKLAICDPQKRFRKKLIKTIVENPECPKNILVLEYDDGNGLLNEVNQFHDLIFMDTKLSEADGLQIMEAIREKNKGGIIVICTKAKHPTPELFKVYPFRYLRKDKYLNEIREEMSCIMRKMKDQTEPGYLMAEGKDGKRKVYVEEIYYIAKIKRACKFFLKDGQRCISRTTLEKLYTILEKEDFEYAHSSYIVSLRYVEKIDSATITMTDNTILTISRRRGHVFKQRLEYYQSHLLGR